jgi:hypothetical protein
MSAPASETTQSSSDNGEADTVLAALQDYFGDMVRVRYYEAYLRKDYANDASGKVRAGGALLVACTVFADQEFTRHELAIDDNHRPFDEAVISQLGALAEANWQRGIGWVRDYSRNL